MTPLLLNRSQIDSTRWNEHISKSIQSVIYAQTFYLDIVAERWQALVWPSIHDFKIVMPLPVKKKWGISVLYQPYFCQYLGIFSLKTLSPFELEAFLKSVSAHFSYISNYHFNPDNYWSLTNCGSGTDYFECSLEYTHWLRIGTAYEQLLRCYSNDRRVNLRRAGKYNWQIEQGKDIAPLIQLFRDYHAHQIDGGVAPEALEQLEALFFGLLHKGNASLHYAYLDNVLHAGILLVKFGNRTIYLFNAASYLGRKGNARTLMLNDHFKKEHNASMIFDFESPPFDSIMQFYNSFGSEKMAYHAIKKNQLPFPLKVLQNWRKAYFIKTRRGLSSFPCKISNPFPANRSLTPLLPSMEFYWNRLKPRAA